MLSNFIFFSSSFIHHTITYHIKLFASLESHTFLYMYFIKLFSALLFGLCARFCYLERVKCFSNIETKDQSYSSWFSLKNIEHCTFSSFSFLHQLKREYNFHYKYKQKKNSRTTWRRLILKISSHVGNRLQHYNKNIPPVKSVYLNDINLRLATIPNTVYLAVGLYVVCDSNIAWVWNIEKNKQCVDVAFMLNWFDNN